MIRIVFATMLCAWIFLILGLSLFQPLHDEVWTSFKTFILQTTVPDIPLFSSFTEPIWAGIQRGIRVFYQLEPSASVELLMLRKLGHLFLYFFLGVFLQCIMPSKRPSFILLFGIFVALADEGFQSLQPGRHPRIQDVWLDTTALGLALVGMSYYERLLNLKSSRH